MNRKIAMAAIRSLLDGYWHQGYGVDVRPEVAWRHPKGRRMRATVADLKTS
ncbi:hypothetical protein [Marinomonas communis]|uniref:hypothetical protein n=1 Tax=Marinomonas communis TaxID=28254 RepID=UPI0013C305DE|nr:hypothetical protein [Marinomonas communis]MCC4274148.1 hypothetical protein [Marinomonas communis]